VTVSASLVPTADIHAE